MSSPAAHQSCSKKRKTGFISLFHAINEDYTNISDAHGGDGDVKVKTESGLSDNDDKSMARIKTEKDSTADEDSADYIDDDDDDVDLTADEDNADYDDDVEEHDADEADVDEADVDEGDVDEGDVDEDDVDVDDADEDDGDEDHANINNATPHKFPSPADRLLGYPRIVKVDPTHMGYPLIAKGDEMDMLCANAIVSFLYAIRGLHPKALSDFLDLNNKYFLLHFTSTNILLPGAFLIMRRGKRVKASPRTVKAS